MVNQLRKIKPNIQGPRLRRIHRPNLQGFANIKNIKYIGVALVIVLAIVFISSRSSGNGQTAGASDSRVQVEDAVATETLNKISNFPIKNSSGEEVSSIEYEIISAEIRNQLIIEGVKKTTKQGRTFLVLNLKITNSYNKAIDVITRNYIRLSVNGDESEWLAPDIYNDPVTVQAISTKPTRLAFLINDSDESFVLQIGEIDGEKERLELTIKAK